MRLQKICDCPKILIVDDNEFNLYSLALLLSSLGYESQLASNGQAAIDLII